MMICPFCDKNKGYLLKMPIIIEKENDDGIITTYTRESFDKDYEHICFDCFKVEVCALNESI
jgi:hypothetical protein